MSSFALFHVFLLLIFTHCRVWYNTKVNVFCHFFNCLFYSADMVYFGNRDLLSLYFIKCKCLILGFAADASPSSLSWQVSHRYEISIAFRKMFYCNHKFSFVIFLLQKYGILVDFSFSAIDIFLSATIYLTCMELYNVF